MLKILDELHEGDRFNIMVFGSTIEYWKPGIIATANRQTIRAAKEYIKQIGIRGCE